jgi:5-methyltetrahydrofolate--homocysteine methyltransferase
MSSRDVAVTLELLHRTLAQRILVLDGAMGTMLQRLKLTEEDFRGERFRAHGQSLKGNGDLLVLTQPETVATIHSQYFAAGADIVETNTFMATAISQSDYGLAHLSSELNVEGARLARRVADEWTKKTPEQPRLVAGSIGPTNRSLSMSPDINSEAFRASSADEMREAYRAQARGLIEGGCDLLLLETIFDTLNAKAALVGIEAAFDETGARLPVMISVTISDRSGRTLSGETLDAFYFSIAPARPFSVGLNCSFGAREIRPYLAELARMASCYVSCHPNAGLPNAFGQYDELPDETGKLLREFAESGLVNIVGGCCGTTPDHISKVAAAVAGVAPRAVPKLCTGT